MRILLITPFLPHPEAMAGAPRAIYDRLRLLCREHQVVVATLFEPGEEERVAWLRASGVRVYAVRRVAAHDGSGRQLWRKRLRLAAGLLADRRPMLAQEFGAPRMCRLLRKLSAREGFDAVLVEHILAAQYLDCLSDGALPAVMTEHDANAALGDETRVGALRRLLPLRLLERLKWRSYARRAYRRAALVTVPTREDAHLVLAAAPRTPVEVAPFGLAPAPKIDDPAAPRDDASLLFVGNFDHPPNRDAGRRLCAEIMPLVWDEIPAARVWLVGRNPTPEIRALAGERVVVTGEVPSVADYLRRCALFVAPLRQGGGMRMKLIEALAAGAPVITTSLGAQGLGAEPGRHLLVADTADGIAAAVVRALRDAGLRERLSAEGKTLSAGRPDEERLRQLTALLRRAAGASSTRGLGSGARRKEAAV